MQTESQPSLSQTPSANRIHIAFFGLRNAGKSTLVNEFCGQEVAIVSDVPGTTTDPVSKAIEILPLGPCVITDTAGLDDDAGALGAERVKRTLNVLATSDIAVWVCSSAAAESEMRGKFDEECRRRGVKVFEFKRGSSAEELKAQIAATKIEEEPGLLDALAHEGERVICVCPIDESAPKGRLILPQVQVLRECLDRHAVCTICQCEELEAVLLNATKEYEKKVLVITDSQAFGEVRKTIEPFRAAVRLTSFSILFARLKGDLGVFAEGMSAVAGLKDGDVVLIAEGCTHHRQCNDIGSVKIPLALKRLTGKNLEFIFASGKSFGAGNEKKPSLIVHCGGCMLTRREMRRRMAEAAEQGVKIINYGLLLAMASGLKPEEVAAWS
ncbi:MAG: 50S ribosome-binding GTPase [Kiritimatiellae bacterium]|nr:50S ribosome-binding GTPase [Kiritimatiellia bacterium]